MHFIEAQALNIAIFKLKPMEKENLIEQKMVHINSGNSKDV